VENTTENHAAFIALPEDQTSQHINA